MRYLNCFAFLVLAGCAAATPIPSKTGKSSYFIECPGSGSTWTACYKKANEVCGGKYTLINKDQGHEATYNSAAAFGGGVGGGSSVGSIGQDRSMSVECN